MKKIILILAVFLISSCSDGVSKRIPLKKGDERITISEKHAIHEKCIGFNSFGKAVWRLDYIESRSEYDQKTSIDTSKVNF